MQIKYLYAFFIWLASLRTMILTTPKYNRYAERRQKPIAESVAGILWGSSFETKPSESR